MFRCTVLFVALVAASLGAAAADEAFLSAFSRHQSLLASGVDDVCDNVSGMSTGCESTLTSIYTNTQYVTMMNNWMQTKGAACILQCLGETSSCTVDCTSQDTSELKSGCQNLNGELCSMTQTITEASLTITATVPFCLASACSSDDLDLMATCASRELTNQMPSECPASNPCTVTFGCGSGGAVAIIVVLIVLVVVGVAVWLIAARRKGVSPMQLCPCGRRSEDTFIDPSSYSTVT